MSKIDSRYVVISSEAELAFIRIHLNAPLLETFNIFADKDSSFVMYVELKEKDPDWYHYIREQDDSEIVTFIDYIKELRLKKELLE